MLHRNANMISEVGIAVLLTLGNIPRAHAASPRATSVSSIRNCRSYPHVPPGPLLSALLFCLRLSSGFGFRIVALGYNEVPQAPPLPYRSLLPASPWLLPPSRVCSFSHRLASLAVATSSSRGPPGPPQPSFSSILCFAAPCSRRTTSTPMSRFGKNARRPSRKMTRSHWRCAE
jgi:hypothetical protein